jgi:hypothetical protein
LAKRGFRSHPSPALVGMTTAVRRAGVRPHCPQRSETLVDGRIEFTLHSFEALDLGPSRR